MSRQERLSRSGYLIGLESGYIFFTLPDWPTDENHIYARTVQTVSAPLSVNTGRESGTKEQYNCHFQQRLTRNIGKFLCLVFRLCETEEVKGKKKTIEFRKDFPACGVNDLKGSVTM